MELSGFLFFSTQLSDCKAVFCGLTLSVFAAGILCGCAEGQKQTKTKQTTQEQTIALKLTVEETGAEETGAEEADKEDSLSSRISSAGWMEKTELPDRLSDLTEYSEEEAAQVVFEFLDRYSRELTMKSKVLCGSGNCYWDEGKEFAVFEAPGDSFVAGNILYLPAGDEETTVSIRNSEGDILWDSGVLDKGEEFFFSLRDMPADIYTVYWESSVSVTKEEDMIKAPLLLVHFFTIPEDMEAKFDGGIAFE